MTTAINEEAVVKETLENGGAKQQHKQVTSDLLTMTDLFKLTNNPYWKGFYF